MTANASRRMALTPELVARVAREVRDAGPDPGTVELVDADYARFVQRLREQAGGEIWVFAYGSLIWNPACAVEETLGGLALGWHRAFRLKLDRWRGTKEQPGLMLVLDRGGRCKGLLQRLPAATAETELEQLLRREISEDPPTNRPTWVRVLTAGRRTVRALAFTISRKDPRYAGRLSDGTTADMLATAVGHLGSGAEYLYRTVAQLEASGIHDPHLWRLQELVAARIMAAPPG
ncbi:MAG: gamma-glutamylcyclotransferase [Geminicoccaceae bacterium]